MFDYNSAFDTSHPLYICKKQQTVYPTPNYNYHIFKVLVHLHLMNYVHITSRVINRGGCLRYVQITCLLKIIASMEI